MTREALLLVLEGRTPFADAWGLQRRLMGARQEQRITDILILVEHTPVITIGRSGDRTHLLAPREALGAQGIEVFEIERGGSATYHGPGQLVAYPILDLRALDEDITRFMRALEESIIRALGDFGIAATRLRGFPGVWVDGAKIAAVGVAVKRRVTMHGMALNVTTDLSHFDWINPCGLGRPVTSMARVLGREVPICDVRDAYARRFAGTYGLDLTPVTREELERLLSGDAARAAPAQSAGAPTAAVRV